MYNIIVNISDMKSIACKRSIMKVFIKNKLLSLSGKSTVTDLSGKPVFDVSGRVISPTKVKHVCSLDGKKLFKIRNRFFNFFTHACFVYDENGTRILKVKNKIFSPDFVIESKSGDTYAVNGKWFSLQASIVKNGQVVGIISRQFTVVADAFELDANPADLAFMVALVIAIDNICDNKRK